MQTRFIAVLALLVLSAATYKSLHNKNVEKTSQIQRQEEVADTLVDIYYLAENEEDEKKLDLLWLQRAAQVVREYGEVFFNIVEQKTGVRKVDNEEFLYMEGIIEITQDIGAEFNAEEIGRVNIEEL